MNTSTIINIHDNSKNRIAKKNSNNILVINEYRFYHHLVCTNMKTVREVGRLISGPSKIAMKNGPCIDGLPIKHGDFPLAILNYQRVPILFGLIIRSRWSNQNIWNTAAPKNGFSTMPPCVLPSRDATAVRRNWHLSGRGRVNSLHSCTAVNQRRVFRAETSITPNAIWDAMTKATSTSGPSERKKAFFHIADCITPGSGPFVTCAHPPATMIPAGAWGKKVPTR